MEVTLEQSRSMSIEMADSVEEEIMKGTSFDDEDAVPDKLDSMYKGEKAHDAADDVLVEPENYGFFERQSVRVANRPCTYFWASLLISLGLGVIGLVVGDFEISVESSGWWSRGTVIGDRHQQFLLLNQFRYELWSDESGDVWTDLINNIQKEDNDDDDIDRRLKTKQPSWTLSEAVSLSDMSELGSRLQHGMQGPWKEMQEASSTDALSPFHMRGLPHPDSMPWLERRLQEEAVNGTGILAGCDVGWYTSDRLLYQTHLWPVWKMKPSGGSFLDADRLKELCMQEEKTQDYLVNSKLCFGCASDDKCLQPYSPVLFARLTVYDGMKMSCDALAEGWRWYESEMENDLQKCVQDIRLYYSPDRDGFTLPASCPAGFFPTILDETFDGTLVTQYSSSIFATLDEHVDDLYDNVDNFAGGTANFDVAYDTQWEDFVNLSLDSQLGIDMSLALGSAVVTTAAIIVHTRSLFLSMVGLVQILLSFPLAYFFYTFVAGLDFFPFLNFIGIFVLFSLGADDVFVAVDKWKNARLENPKGTTQQIAAKALPDAAEAMLLTTTTTAVAFFGTAVCPVAPIMCFAVFCGLLIVMDYIMCVVLVFPALCIYDSKRDVKRFCCRCHGCGRCAARGGSGDDDDLDATPSLIRRLLAGFYNGLHRARWVLLTICVGTLAVTTYYASTIELPTSSDVRLYDENDNQYEQNFLWRQNLLYDVLSKEGGSTAHIVWGLTPADTGVHGNPESWTQLVLDDSFEPSSEEAQTYLRDFCDDFFTNDFAQKIEATYVCPINRFDAWLGNQTTLETPDEAYAQFCGGASGLPMPQDQFDACITAWSRSHEELSILSRNGKVEVMTVRFSSRVRYDSPFDQLENEWNALDNWFSAQNIRAPAGVNKAYFTSADFWWYDTNGEMLNTAFTSAGIALAASAAIILISSRSFVLTLFSTITVGYVLTSVTAMLVAVGWTLGFLESILFAILIGISCDFVIHFSHAYASLNGHATRSERTKHALIMMGPSILAAAFTTFAAATVMLFTVITFFEKFAVVLFLTVLMAVVGSFVVFLTLVDCMGPSDPTYLYDRMIQKCCRCFGRDHEIQGDQKTQHPSGEF